MPYPTPLREVAAELYDKQKYTQEWVDELVEKCRSMIDWRTETLNLWDRLEDNGMNQGKILTEMEARAYELEKRIVAIGNHIGI